MRLDLFLKQTGIIPRRSVAKRACEQGLVELNGMRARPSTEVRVGDRLVVRVGMRVTEHEVLQLPHRAVAKAQRGEYVRLISSERVQFGPL